MQDVLRPTDRLYPPIDFLNAYPYPAFIFSSPRATSLDPSTPQPRDENNPASPPTLVNTDAVDHVDSSTPNGGSNPPQGRPSHLPLVWYNRAWDVLAKGHQLEQCLDPLQLNNLRIWLLDSRVGRETATATATRATPDDLTTNAAHLASDEDVPESDHPQVETAKDNLDAYFAGLNALPDDEPATGGGGDQLTLEMDVDRSRVRLVCVRTVWEGVGVDRGNTRHWEDEASTPTNENGGHGANGANGGIGGIGLQRDVLIIVQTTIIQPRATRSRCPSSIQSRLTDRYAVSKTTLFQAPPSNSPFARDWTPTGGDVDMGVRAERLSSAGSSDLTEENLNAHVKRQAALETSSEGGRQTVQSTRVVARRRTRSGWVEELVGTQNGKTLVIAQGSTGLGTRPGIEEALVSPKTIPNESSSGNVAVTPEHGPHADVDMDDSNRSDQAVRSRAGGMSVSDYICDLAVRSRVDRSLPERESIHYLLRSTDWQAVGLPPLDDWPTWLQAIVSVVIQTPHEACFWATEDNVMIYNASYARMTPSHPWAFGKPGREGWGDVWPNLEPLLRSVQKGERVYRKEDLWLFQVPDHPHKVETYHRLVLVPVMGPDGQCLGIMNNSNEETDAVIARRRLKTLRTIADFTVHARTADEFREGLTDAVSLPESARDIPYLMAYHVQAEEEAPAAYFPAAPRQTHRKVKLTLATSVGCPLPHASVPLEVELQVPSRQVARPQSVVNPVKILRGTTASPAMSAASSIPSRRASSQASINSHLGLPEPVLQDSPGPLTEWPFLQAFMTDDLLHVEDASNLVQDFEIRCWEDVPTSAVMFSLTEKGSKTPLAIMILGLNYRRPFDAAYREWLRQLRASLVNGLLSVRTTEFEAIQRQSTLELERAKEVFFSNIAHELKSPLTLIAGPISDLVDIVRDEKSKTLLKMAQRNVARLARLVSNLMDFSRIEAGKLNGHFRNVNVGAVTANLASMWRSAVEKAGLRFVVDCDDSHTPQNAYIDLDCWEKILFNLISNAYKYTSEGTISVRLTYTQHSMELAVEDTGRGVSFASLPHLLERFHRSPEAEGSGVEGTGIGLAYTSELVRLHGGHLVVDSKVASESADGSHGSSFQVIIPLGTDHLDADRVETADVEAQISKYGLDFIEEATYWSRDRSDGSSETTSDFGGSMESSEGSSLRGLTQTTLFFDKRKDVILVADDSTDMRKYIKSLLLPYVKAVIEAKDGQHALDLAVQHKPTLILSDVTMPRMSGTEMLAKIRGDPDLASTPVVLITAKAGEDDRVDGLLSGADDYMSKPFKARELIARVNLHVQLGKRRAILERKFAEQNAELQIISDYAPVGIVRSTADGALTFANEVWYDQSGYQPRGGPLDDWGKFVHPDDIDKLVRDWYEFMNGEPRQAELQWRWLSGAWIVGIFVRLDKISPDLSGCIGCTTDISGQKRNEEEQLRRLEEEKQRRIEAVAAKQQQELLIDVTSHELRNPISAVIQCSTVVNQNLQDLRKQIENHVMGVSSFEPSREILQTLNEDIDALESIYQCGLSQSRIADDVLSLGRIQLDMLQIHPIPTDIYREAQKLLSVFSTEARKLDIALTLEFGPGVDRYGSFIFTDPVRLGQVVTNLLNNAIRFTQTSDVRQIKVTIDLCLDPPSDDSCMVPVEPTDKQWAHGQQIFVYASFQDSGPGLAPKELEKLFRRFSQASSETHTIFGGSGLGLFVCRKICEMMGGRIEVASTFGQGSTFRFFIEARACEPPPPASAIPTLPGEKQVVSAGPDGDQLAPKRSCLIVEDNIINSKVLVRQLKKAGYTVDPAFNGLEGLTKMRANKYKYDCVLMDLEMPIMDGLTAVKQLRKEEKELGLRRNLVIALTGNAREQQRQNALDAGMDAVIIKPYSAQQLLDKIGSMIEEWTNLASPTLGASSITAL